MKKSIIVGAVVLVIAGSLWYEWSRHTTAPDAAVTVMPSTTRPDASNATFNFEDGPVTLESGTSQNVDLTNYVAYGDVNQDGKNDAAVILVQSGGGSGVFIYLAAYVSGNVTYKGSNTVFLGDRVSPQSISIDANGVIKVTYLDRSAGEPMADDPTVPVTKTFVYRAGQLEEN